MSALGSHWSQIQTACKWGFPTSCEPVCAACSTQSRMKVTGMMSSIVLLQLPFRLSRVFIHFQQIKRTAALLEGHCLLCVLIAIHSSQSAATVHVP